MQIGQFCRGCCFDLDGLPMDELDKCPECGKLIGTPTNRRTTLRRSSLLGYFLAFAVLIIGAGMLGISSGGQTRAVVGVMPNSIVIWLTDLGVDEALDELVIRTSNIPNTMTVKQWGDAIDSGLAFQADSTLSWDRRWGQVLFDAVQSDQMNDAQLGRYITVGVKFELVVRDRVHPDTIQVPNLIFTTHNRMEPVNGGRTGLILLSQITAYGFEDQEPTRQTKLYEYPRYVDIFNDGPKSRGSIGMDHPLNKEPGEQFMMYFEYQSRLNRNSESEPVFERTVREEFEITVIDPDTPLVRVVRDRNHAQDIFDSIQMMPILVPEEYDSGEQSRTRMSSSTILVHNSPPVPFAHRVFLVFDDYEAQVGQLSHTSTDTNNIGGMIMLTPNPRHGLTPERAMEVHKRLIGLQTVRVELRTDPSLLLREPMVDQALGINIVFDEVPVQIIPVLSEPGSFDEHLAVKPSSFDLVDGD